MSSKDLIKIVAETKDYLWGGNKLRDYGKVSDKDKIAESWELSYHKDGPSKTENGELLSEVLMPSDLGKNVNDFDDFPVLVKLIDSADNLSVQVHPSDDFAIKNEGQFGKTEMWYIVDCDEGAGIYLGLKEDTDKEVFKKAIDDGTVTDLLNFYQVKKGDWFFIKSGTIHAIGKGVTVCEIQQNSNLTYRVYDFKRKGADGKERPLHIEKALTVSNFNAFTNSKLDVEIGNKRLIGASKYFSAYFADIDGEEEFDADKNTHVFSFDNLDVLENFAQILIQEKRKTANTAVVLEYFLRIFNTQKQKTPNQTTSLSDTYFDFSVNYITSNLHTKITVNQLTELLGISQPRLYTIFKEKIGVSPKRYIDNCKLARAKTLLNETNMTITQIANSIGFTDVLTFSKFFSANEKRSPSNFRKS